METGTGKTKYGHDTHKGTRSWGAHGTKTHNRSMGVTSVGCQNLSSALNSVIYRYTGDAPERPPKPEQRQVENIFNITKINHK